MKEGGGDIDGEKRCSVMHDGEISSLWERPNMRVENSHRKQSKKHGILPIFIWILDFFANFAVI